MLRNATTDGDGAILPGKVPFANDTISAVLASPAVRSPKIRFTSRPWLCWAGMGCRFMAVGMLHARCHCTVHCAQCAALLFLCAHHSES
jgi:hypothetical protein